jgi:type I restriction enzyme R subunit
VDRAFLKKTDELVQSHIDTARIEQVTDFVEINASTIEVIKQKKGGDGTKIINLVKSIEKKAEEESDDPFLIALAERAKAVQESFEDRQVTTAQALGDLLAEIQKDEQRKKAQAAKGFDGLTFFVYRTLLDDGIGNAEDVSRKIKQAFLDHPNWLRSEKELRELRKKVTFAVYAQEDDLDKVTNLVDNLLTLLQKAFRI